MNITTRKLAMLEKIYQAQEEIDATKDYVTNSIEEDLKLNVKNLMDKIRSL